MQRRLIGFPTGSRPTFFVRPEIRWGIAGFAILLAIVLAVALLSVTRTGTTTYRAAVSDAGFLKTGDEVRLAGIKVGTVTGLELQPDQVAMTFTVTDGVAVGDDSTLSIRMLTVVGGYYVALQPAGSAPLGTGTIPAERVTLPYSLPMLFQDAVTPVEGLDGDTMRQTLEQLGEATSGSPDAIRRAVGAVGSVVDILNRQNREVSRTLAVADEYVTAINITKSVLRQFITSSNILEDLAEQSLTQVGSALGTVGRVLARLTPVSERWRDTFKPMAVELADTIPSLQELYGQLSDLSRAVIDLGNTLRPFDDGSAGPRLCIPNKDRSC